MELNNKEAATVLAALRCFQGQQEAYMHMDHFVAVAPLSDDGINSLCERLNFLPKPDTSAKVQITWSPGDVQTLRPRWSLKKCEKWLNENRKAIYERSIELGWEIMGALL